MKLVRTNFYYFIVVWLIVLVLMGSVLYMGYLRNIRDLRQLMINEAERLADVVNVATVVGIDALEDIEFLTAYRLFDNASFIDRMFAGRIPGEASLDEIVREHDLHAVNILGPDGSIIADGGFETEESEDFHITYAQEIAAVLNGGSRGEFLGFERKRHKTGTIKGVAIPRTGGGAIIIQASIDKLFEYRQSFGLGTLGTLFADISRDKGVRYIVLQDTLGIVVASPNIGEMTRIKSDPFLIGAYNRGYGYRTISVNGEEVLEVVQSFVTGDRDFGLLRIGLTTQQIETIQANTIRHFTLLFFVALVSGAFVFLYVIQRQNYMLLNTEHDRILREVKIMEEETRRAERLASMGYLAAGVAHEIRNPLNSISLIVQQIKDETEDSNHEHAAMLTTVGSEITRIGSIIENFLRFAKPQNLSLSTVPLETIVGDVLDIVRIRAEVSGIRIDTDVERDAVCICDADQIKQALVNIVLNAIDAIGTDGVIAIGARLEPDCAVFAVEDTGGGIEKEILTKVFDPYFTTKDSGTGLGLSEVHRIVSAHGGRVRAENSGGGGAVFTIELPAGEG